MFLNTRRIALKDGYHRERMDMLAYTPVEFNYLQTFAKTFIVPVRQNQFTHENILSDAPVREITIAMNTNSAFTGSYTEYHSGIINLISDKIEYSEEVSQS